MSQPDEEVQMKIQQTLASINDVTIKIKKELMMIADLIRDEGRLGTAVKDANEVLANVAKDLGIDVTRESDKTEEDKEQLDDLLVPVTPDLITNKLMTLVDDNQQR